jgi:hypothetical protein
MTPSVLPGKSKPLFSGLDRLLEFRAIQVQLVQVVSRVTDIPRCQQQACNRQFLDSIGICARCVKHRHTAFGHSLYRNIVDTGSGAPNRSNRLRDIHVMHLVGTQYNRIRIRNPGCHFVSLPRQAT